MAKKYNEETILKRLISIQQIKDAIRLKRSTSDFKTIDKITYILWQQAQTRNSDITLAIQFYKEFYPEYIQDEKIAVKDFFKIPKMYDIQRIRADIQNTEGLFPATDEIREQRIKREEEYRKFYKNKKRKSLKFLPDYYLYLDESGKNEKYYVLAGILLNGEKSVSAQQLRFNYLKKILNSKYHLNIKEFKFTDISKRNIEYYKELIDIVFKEGLPITFVSIVVDNKNLKRNTEKNKNKELLELLLKDKLTSLIVRATCCSSYASDKAKIAITIDKAGCGLDSIEREKLTQNLDTSLKERYKYFVELTKLNDVDSKNEILIQLSDLYASSINNVFSKIKADTPTSKAKKEFAEYLLEHIGLKNLHTELSNVKSQVKFINKFITSK